MVAKYVNFAQQHVTGSKRTQISYAYKKHTHSLCSTHSYSHPFFSFLFFAVCICARMCVLVSKYISLANECHNNNNSISDSKQNSIAISTFDQCFQKYLSCFHIIALHFKTKNSGGRGERTSTNTFESFIAKPTTKTTACSRRRRPYRRTVSEAAGFHVGLK